MAQEPLRVHAFGTLRLSVGERPVVFATIPKVVPLFAYLLLHRNVALAREVVAYALWPDDTETDARANLRRHLHQLLRVLPPAATQTPWLLAQGRTIRLNPAAPIWLDCDVFERGVRHLRKREAAIDLYTGDLLESIDEEWLIGERERLRALYVQTLARMLDDAIAGGDREAVIRHARGLLRGDPLREDALRRLMLARNELGDRAGALGEYEAFTRRLDTELGVEPAPETQALYDVIRRPASVRGAEPRDPGDRRDALPFVGREMQVAMLLRRWETVARAEGGAFIVSGEAGVGKSRLAQEFARCVLAQGGRALVGGTGANETQPYQPIVEALRAGLASLLACELEDVWLASLAKLVPEVRRRTGPVATAPKLAPEADRQRLFDAIAETFARLARVRPLLLVFEDLHWAQAATIDCIVHLVRRAATEPLLVLATYRGEEVGRGHAARALSRLEQDGTALGMPLGRFDAHVVEEVVDVVLPHATDRAALARDLHARSEGNALFLREALYDYVAGAGNRAGDGARPRPSAGSAILRARIDALPEGTRALADAAAVLGQGFDLRVACELCGWSQNEALDAIDALLDARIVRQGTPRSRTEYAFSHHLIAQFAYEGVSEESRRTLHRRSARALQELFPDRVGELAGEIGRHWERAGNAVAAAEAYACGAKRASELFANEDALALAAKALAHATDARARFDLHALCEEAHRRSADAAAQRVDLIAMERACFELGDLEAACETLRRRVAAFHTAADRANERLAIDAFHELAALSPGQRWKAQAVYRDALYHAETGGFEKTIALLTPALSAKTWRGDAEGAVAARCLLAKSYAILGRTGEADAAIAEARAIAQRGGLESLARVLETVASLSLQKRDFVTLRATAFEALAVAERLGDREKEADMYAQLAIAYTRLGELERARDAYARAAATFKSIGKRLGEAVVILNSAHLRYVAGDIRGAHDGNERAARLFDAIGDPRGRAIARYNMAHTSFLAGDLDAAEHHVNEALDLGRNAEGAWFEANCGAVLGQIALARGRPEDAAAHLAAALAIGRTLANAREFSDDLADYALATFAAGDRERALATADELAALPEESWSTNNFPQKVFWAIAVVLGDVAGREREARAALARAFSLFDERRRRITDPAQAAEYASLAYNRVIVEACEHDRRFQCALEKSAGTSKSDASPAPS